MPGGLLSLVSSPIADFVGQIGGTIRSFVTTDADRLKAQQALDQLQADLTVKLTELDTQWAASQASVITAETKSQSWMARNWRPLLMLTFTFIIAWNFIIAPLFTLPKADIPDNMWELLKLGMGGYIFGRSAEKIVPGVTSAIQAAKAPAAGP
jgi:Holin of 3TMs, for gene-transfer release